MRRIPALVVSGFLGSGKTSLVRHLLADAQTQGLRVAVVSNEFGALGIDASLLGSGGEAFVELEGGCVCCQLSDELVDTLQMLREQVDPDRVIVETSGVGLPYDTQLNFWRPPVDAWIADDVALVVVNAEQVRARRELEGTFEDQVSSADLLLLNKVDLVAQDELGELESTLAELAPEGTPIVRTEHGAVAPALLFPPDPSGSRAERRRSPRANPHSHESFEASELAVEPGLTADELRGRLHALAPLRAKGFVQIREGLRLVQGVGPRIELEPLEQLPPGAVLGRIVLIRRADAGGAD